MRTRAEDEVVDLLFARTLDYMLFFTNRGRVYGQRVFALPDTARDGRGLPLVNFLNLSADERVTAILVVPDFSQAKYVTLLTRKARIKRIKLEEFEAVRPSGIIAMNLEPSDELAWACATSGRQDFILVTAGGRALRFAEDEVRAMGRTAAGVMGMRLAKDDVVASFDVVEPGGDLLLLTQRGYGKRTPLDEFTVHGRNGQGLWALDHTKFDKLGKVVAALVVQAADQVTIITSGGVALRTPVANISQVGRATQGVRIVNIDEGDTVAAMARLSAEIETQAEISTPAATATQRPTNGKVKVPEPVGAGASGPVDEYGDAIVRSAHATTAGQTLDAVFEDDGPANDLAAGGVTDDDSAEDSGAEDSGEEDSGEEDGIAEDDFAEDSRADDDAEDEDTASADDE